MEYKALTGLSWGQLTRLHIMVLAEIGSLARPGAKKPLAVGLFHPVAMVVTLMRSNITRARAGNIFGCSQPTVSRRWDLLRPVIGKVLASFVPVPVQVLGRHGTALADGTICPTWDWNAIPDAMKERASAPGGCWKLQGIRLHQARRPTMTEAYDGRQVVGMDLHRRRSVLVRLTEDGRELETVRIGNSPAALRAVLAWAGKNPRVAVEATYGWYWAADVLQEAGAEVHLAHPLGVKAFTYRRVKNDPLTELSGVSTAQAGGLSQRPIAGMSGRSESPGSRGLAASPIATETGHTRRNQSAAFSSLPIFDVSRSAPGVLLQRP